MPHRRRKHRHNVNGNGNGKAHSPPALLIAVIQRVRTVAKRWLPETICDLCVAFLTATFELEHVIAADEQILWTFKGIVACQVGQSQFAVFKNAGGDVGIIDAVSRNQVLLWHPPPVQKPQNNDDCRYLVASYADRLVTVIDATVMVWDNVHGRAISSDHVGFLVDWVVWIRKHVFVVANRQHCMVLDVSEVATTPTRKIIPAILGASEQKEGELRKITMIQRFDDHNVAITTTPPLLQNRHTQFSVWDVDTCEKTHQISTTGPAVVDQATGRVHCEREHTIHTYDHDMNEPTDRFARVNHVRVHIRVNDLITNGSCVADRRFLKVNILPPFNGFDDDSGFDASALIRYINEDMDEDAIVEKQSYIDNAALSTQLHVAGISVVSQIQDGNTMGRPRDAYELAYYTPGVAHFSLFQLVSHAIPEYRIMYSVHKVSTLIDGRVLVVMTPIIRQWMTSHKEAPDVVGLVPVEVGGHWRRLVAGHSRADCMTLNDCVTKQCIGAVTFTRNIDGTTTVKLMS